MNEEQYHALCHSCDEILFEDPENPSRLAVAWLHVIREHPVFLQRYQGLFLLPSIPWRLSWVGLRRALIEVLRTLRQLVRACGSNLLGAGGWQKQLEAADVVFVSHLANPSQREAETDFYFGELPALLAQRGQRVAVVLIDHTAASSIRTGWVVSERGVIRLVLPNTMGLTAEIGLLVALWRQSSLLARQAVGADIRAKVRMAAAAEALSSASFQALRIAIQVGELVRRMHARVLITTYEGHAWERTTYLEARRQVPGIRCGGYQHAALFRFQHGLRRQLGTGCDPDVVFLSGNAALSQSAGSGESAAFKIRVLGSSRAGSLARLPDSEARRRRRQMPVCLVIPEGLIEESTILFRYALRCASRLQDVTFIWRLHPILSFETLVKHDPIFRDLPQNVRLSDASLEADAERASWALYRGSTAIVSAALAGAAPVYVRQEGEMTIDPLYALDAERAVASTVDEFVALINSGEYPTVDQVDAVARHCLEIFSPMNPGVLFDYLDAVKNEHGAAANGSFPLSVVIATLGGCELETTIQLLLAGTRLPEEILICIPEGVQPKARIQEDGCVHVVWTPCRGQVAQRAYGLAQARNPFVIQMDDDVSMPAAALEQLFAACLKRGPGNAVAPLFRHCGTDEYLTRYQPSLRGVLQSLSASLIGGAPWGPRRMGSIDQAGIPYAIDRDYCNGTDFVETEWLPGGCVICRREDLVVDNYYPFSGKAYSEDVIHSILWRQRGVRLWIAANISVCTLVAPMPVSLAAIRDDYRARAYVVSLIGGSQVRCRLWFVLSVIRRWLAQFIEGRT